MFGDAKPRGLNLEDTRITDVRKLVLLFAIVAIAIAWSSIIAAKIIGRGTITRKSQNEHDADLIMDGGKLPDMGRMFLRWPLGERISSLWGQRMAADPPRSPTR